MPSKGSSIIPVSVVDSIVTEYKQGSSIKFLAKKHNVSVSPINRILARNNVCVRKRKHTFDEKYFDKIDTETKAYLLGYLWADGWNYRNPEKRTYIVAMELHSKDVEVLELLRRELNYSGEIEIRKPRKKKTFASEGPHCQLRLCSKYLSDKLNEIGMVSRKSLVCLFPRLDDKLVRHFVRGYFDGDGSMTMNNCGKDANFNILSSQEFCQSLLDVIESDLGVKSVVRNRKDSKIKQIAIGGAINTIKIMDWMYSDATCFLKRKREKFVRFLTNYKKKDFFFDTTRSTFDRESIFNKYAII